MTDWDGRRQDWNLAGRWQGSELVLPPLGNGPGASDAITTYLGRQKGWKTLREPLSDRGCGPCPTAFAIVTACVVTSLASMPAASL